MASSASDPVRRLPYTAMGATAPDRRPHPSRHPPPSGVHVAEPPSWLLNAVGRPSGRATTVGCPATRLPPCLVKLPGGSPVPCHHHHQRGRRQATPIPDLVSDSSNHSGFGLQSPRAAGG
nr:uncharacterized protein LOC127334509 [Lolium perenne]